MSYFASTHFYSVFYSYPQQNSPFLWTSASEDRQNFTQVRCTKPSSWCFTPWILSKVMHLSHEHEGSSAPRMAMLEIYSSFIIKNCKIFPESCERLFTRGCSDQTRENGFKLKQGRFRLDIWKKSFTMLLLRHWNIVPGEAVDSPPPESVQGWTGWGSE